MGYPNQIILFSSGGGLYNRNKELGKDIAFELKLYQKDAKTDKFSFTFSLLFSFSIEGETRKFTCYDLSSCTGEKAKSCKVFSVTQLSN